VRRNDEINMTEPILCESASRKSLHPIEYRSTWEFYKKSVASFWTAEEIDLAHDAAHWNKLTDDERHFIKTVLAFFAQSDGIVLENLAARFMREIKIPEARAFYGFQIAMENVHSEAYSLMIDAYVKDAGEKDRLFRAIDHFASVREKAEWATRWASSDASFAHRVVAFACVEGIFFSGSFCAIFWLKKRGLMPGLTFSNELISRDEGLHTDFACHVYSMLERPLAEDEVRKIFEEAVDIERSFICESLPCSLIGMNAESMTRYIEFVADRLAVCLGARKLYSTPNPFPWMELISLQGKTNFFERRVGEYQKSGVMAGLEGSERVFSTKCEF
jgi:ribonucleoside-diphosphate reductase subunit M2